MPADCVHPGSRQASRHHPAPFRSAFGHPRPTVQTLKSGVLIMKPTTIALAAAFALVAAGARITPPAFAAASNYKFDLVNARPAASDKTDVTVRLTHLPDGKPVAGAVIF